jgi:hypothetical protein
MDLAYTEKQKAFRQEVREWLAANVPPRRLRASTPRRAFASTAHGKRN